MNDELKEIIEKEKQQGQMVFGQEIKENKYYEYAGPLQRIFAYSFDGALCTAIFLLMGDPHYENVTKELMGQQIIQEKLVLGIPIWYFFLYFLVVNVAMQASPLQATPGKLLFFIKVLNKDGGELGFLRVLFREILKAVPILTFITWITHFFSEKKQCIHDMIASSVVVKKNDLSSIIFFPALIITLALNAGVIYMLPDSKGNTPVQTTELPQFVSQENKEEALKNAIIPDDEKLGSIKIDGEEVELNSVFVRLKDMVKYTSFGDLKKLGNVLEIAFYEDELNSEKLRRLNSVSNLMSDSKTVVKNNPVALLTMQSDIFDSNCKNQIIKDSDLILNSDYFGGVFKENKKVKLRVDDMKLNSLIIMNCDAIKAGNELFFSMQSPVTFQDGKRAIFNVRFTEKIRELKYLGGYVYRHSDPKLVLAVYNKEQQLMKIAFYPEAFSKESLNVAYTKGILPTSPSPGLVLEIPVNGQLYGSGRDIVRKGYTINFKNLPSEIGKELAHRDYSMKFAPGEIPARFVIQSPHAPQIQGRLEGLKEISSPAGINVLAWNVSFNSRLILIKR